MPASPKIITKLQVRRQAEAELRQIRLAAPEEEVRRQAEKIAALGPEVMRAVVANLDRADAQLVAAMGVVATCLNRGQIVETLRVAVQDPLRTDHGRLVAMTILGRFLGEAVDDELLGSLADPVAVAVSSLTGVLGQAEGNPAVLIEYLQSLDRQEPDVVLAVVRALLDRQETCRVDLLRMMAQDVRQEIATEAIRTLGSLHQPDAARALQILIPIVEPGVRDLAIRLLRKLQFSGVTAAPLPLPEPGWRSLISPIDGEGQQSVWFIQEQPGTILARFLRVLLSDRHGAVQAAGHGQVSVLALPAHRPVGFLHEMALPGSSGAILMLEAPYDLGRRLVLDSLAQNRATQIPVAAVLRGLDSWLWGNRGADSPPARTHPDGAAEGEALSADVDLLLRHPAFISWLEPSERILTAVGEVVRYPGMGGKVLANRLIGEILAEPEAVRQLASRLKAMSEWLLLAGDEKLARLALVSAETMPGGGLQTHPFLEALIARQLEAATGLRH